MMQMTIHKYMSISMSAMFIDVVYMMLANWQFLGYLIINRLL